MVKLPVLKKVILILMLLSGTALCAQQIQTELELNPRQVYPGQPAVLTVRVYTSTWFTDPVNFKTRSMDQGFVVPYKQTFPVSKRVGQTNLPGIQFSYLVFPLGEDAVFPPLELEVTSPPEGDFIGRKQTVRTARTPLNIRALPEGRTPGSWLPARKVSITESWDVPPSPKAGDVLTRTVRITASGTLSHFIPPPEWPENGLSSVYPQDAVTSDNKDSDNLYGTRVQSVRYLLENDGLFELPPVELEWFDLDTESFKTASLPAFSAQVWPNPELGYQDSLEERLEAYRASLEPQEAKKIPWDSIGLGTLIMAAVWVIFSRAVKWIRRLAYRIRAARRRRRQSEAFLFRRLSRSHNHQQFHRNMMRWYDRFRCGKTPSLTRRVSKDLPENQKNQNAGQNLAALNRNLFAGGQTPVSVRKIRRGLQSLRKEQNH